MVRVIEGGLFSLKKVLDFHMSRGRQIELSNILSLELVIWYEGITCFTRIVA
jgi:hypothetical protein